MSDRMKDIIRRTLVMLPDIPVMALGVAMYTFANLGGDPFTSFQQGISLRTGIPMGYSSMACNIGILIIFLFINRKMIHVGSIVFSFGLGPFINLWLALFEKIFPNGLEGNPVVRYLFPIIGTLVIIVTLAYYLPIDLGIQALDMIAITIGEKLLHKTYGWGLYITYGVMFVIAILMGAPWGFGTLVATFCVGKGVDIVRSRIAPTIQKWCGIKPAASTAENS